MKPFILITNDDGVHAPGIHCLAQIASTFGEVYIVAPAAPQSGMSSAITVSSQLQISRHPDSDSAQVYSVTGTPVDCVKLALHAIVPRKPDLVLSGINHGSNSGTAVTYSGTMGAVLEGCMAGIPSVGFSLLHHSLKARFDLAAPFIADIIADVLARGLDTWTCLNVNIPALITPLGVRACRAARGHWSEEYQRYTDPSGAPFYRLTGRFVNEEPQAADTDEYYLSRGYISLVPVTPDQTISAAIPAAAARFDR